MADKIDTQRTGEIMQTVLQVLRDAGEPVRSREVLECAKQRLDLTEHELAVLENSGYIRWEAAVHWTSVDFVKAGFIHKANGKWSITEEGIKAIDLPPSEVVREARAKYRKWKQDQKSYGDTQPNLIDDDDDEGSEATRQAAYDQAVDKARTEIEKHILDLGPYDFQKLVAELLRAMGYSVPVVAPPGPDGGIDIVAYKDPLGTTEPRIRCQVKHRASAKVNIAEVRAMEGVLRKSGDMGLIVSSGGFTSDAEREIQVSSKHIEAMDLDRLITLWQTHYDTAREQGKALLPMVKVFFLSPVEE